MDFTKALVVCNGDIPSAALLYKIVEEKGAQNVTILYPQLGTHNEAKQMLYVYSLAANLHPDVAFRPKVKLLDLSAIAELSGALYQPMSAPEIPFQRGVIIATAVSYAYSKGIRAVYMPSTRDDGKYDTVTEFDVPMANAVIAGTDRQVTALMPFERDSLQAVVLKAKAVGVPFGLTWSCYHPEFQGNGFGPHCGVCDGCKERKRGFKDTSKLKDATTYEYEE